MPNPFVWFDLRTPAKDAAQRFYSSLLSWQIDDDGTMAAGTEPWIPELRARCARILGNPHDADDAVQETLIKAWRKLGGYHASGPLRAWLHTIATNTSLNLLKAVRRDDVAEAAEAETGMVGPGPDERL